MMLENLLGLRLVLWMGATIPLPASPATLAALTKVQVIQDADGEDGFELGFVLGKDRSFDYSLLGSLEPFNRVVIGVIMGVLPEVLIDGVITQIELTPSSQPGQSSLSVKGRGLTQVLDLDERDEEFPNQPDFLIFTRIIGNYAKYGLIPKPSPTTNIPIMLQRIPRQAGTDLAFIRRMAQRNGFKFYIEPVTFGVNLAVFGPEVRAGLPQPALNIDLGAFTNINSLSFTNNSLAAVSTSGSFVEPFLKTSLPIPSLPSLRLPPLASSSASARRTVRLRQSAQQDIGQAASSAISTVTNAPEAVQGSGSLETTRYGHVLRARQLVGVRGAGRSYDGFYFVRKVTHTLERGAHPKYDQSFTISREGTGALLPVVRP
jgi:hypothetical protein